MEGKAGDSVQLKDIGKLALNTAELAAALGIGKSKAQELLKTPGFPTVRLGRRVVVPVDALKEWLDSQIKDSPNKERMNEQ